MFNKESSKIWLDNTIDRKEEDDMNDITNPYEIAKFIKESNKITPVKLYIKGDVEKIEFSNCKVFGFGDSRIVFGEYEVINPILEKNKKK